MKNLSAFGLLFLIVSGRALGLQTPSSLTHSAFSLYAAESEDYSRTLSETLDEYKYLKQKNLRDQFEEKITRLEGVLSKSNNEVLSELEKYASENGIENLDDSLMMRLAQLNYERANFDLNEKMRIFENETAQYQLGRRKDAPVPPTPDYKRAVAYATELIKKYPNSSLDDRAHYLLAYCLSEEGKDDEAAKSYAALITLHPFSDIVPEAKWRLAEYHFDIGKFTEALSEYRNLADGKGVFSEKALYKEGATYFAVGQYNEALKVFIRLLNESSNRLGSSDSDAATLYDEAIDYLAHLRAKNLKFTLDEETDALVTERLAEAYRHNQDNEAARRTLFDYVTTHANSKAVPRFMNDIISGYEARGERLKAQDVRNKFINLFSASSSFWSKYRTDVATTVETQDLYETLLLASAEFYAEKARQSKRPFDFTTAINFYTQFVHGYPTSPLRGQAFFEKGELEYGTARFAQAADSYANVIKLSEDSEYKEDAAYGYVLAVAKSVGFPLEEQGTVKAERKTNGALAPASSLGASEKAFINAVDIYTAAISKGSHRQKILYRAAEVFFKHNQFDAVRKHLDLILRDKEDSGLFANAVRMIGVTYDLEGNLAKVAEINNRLLGSEPIVNLNAVGMDTAITVGSAGLMGAWRLENLGQLSEAAAAYEQYALSNSSSADVPFALLQAGLLYRQASEIVTSNRILARLTKEHPKSKYAVQAEFFKAANDQSVLKFGEAAEAYESFGRKYPTHFLSTQAFINAGILHKDLLDFDKAAFDYEQYSHRVISDEISFEVASLYEKAKKFDMALRIYDHYAVDKYGHDLYVMALFKRARLAYENAQNTHARLDPKEDCARVEAASKRYQGSLGAKALNAVTGCTYFETVGERNVLLNQKQVTPQTSEQVAQLMKRYFGIQAKPLSEYTFLTFVDSGKIYEGLAAVKTVSGEARNEYMARSAQSYRKAYELRETTENIELVSWLVDKLHGISPETVALFNTADFWTATAHDTRLVQVDWPTSGAPLKVIFDTRDWPRVEREATSSLEIEPVGYLYAAQARAQAEQGLWIEARNTLLKCVSKTKDTFCAADLLQMGYAGTRAAELKDIVETASKKESHAAWKVALAQYNVRQKLTREALVLAQQAVAEDLQYAPAYTFMSQLFIDLRRPEAARLALKEGAKNTDGDEELAIQLGHRDIDSGLTEQSQAIADQFTGVDGLSGRVRAFLARQVYARGNESQVMANLGDVPTTQPDKSDVLTAKLYFSMALKNRDEAARVCSALAPSAGQYASSSYLMALYESAFKNDFSKAQSYLAQARDQGAWGPWFDSTVSNSHPNRTPSQEAK